MAILAIDQGTSGTKAIVVDEPGAPVLGSASVEVRPRRIGRHGVQQDPQALLESVLHAGREAVSRAGVSIDAVTLANQGETVLAWDPGTGSPLSEAVVWQDGRSADICRDLVEDESWVGDRTGLTIDPYFSAPKMRWLRDNVTREGVVTTSDTWLVYQLTGQFVTDASTASRSLLTRLEDGEWDADLLALFHLEDERLPRICASDEIVGTTDSFGRTEVPVAGLIVDQAAALFAQSCHDEGSAKCTFGTGAFLLANTGHDGVRSSHGLSASVAWRLRGELTQCLDGQVFTAASAIHWLQDIGLLGQAQDIDRITATETGAVRCVPALAGLGAPYWQPSASASFVGMTLGTTREELVLAVLQGIAAQVADLVAAVEADQGRTLQSLRVDGGMTRSAKFMQVLADIVQVPLEVYPTPDATALGAAALGRMALAPASSMADAVGRWRSSASYEPQWAPARALEFRDSWRSHIPTERNEEDQ